jgi:small subunit ribosomal protein S3Ae
MSKKEKSDKARTRDAWKEKKIYDVYGPKSFKNQFIGKIIGKNPDYILNRTIESLLYDFTGDYNDITTVLRFKIIKIEGERCETYLVGHKMTKDFVRSLIRKGVSKIQMINNYKTADNYVYRITSICTTIRKARSSQIITIRKIMDDILKSFARDLNHEKFIRGMIFGEFTNQIKRVGKTIYPLNEAIIMKSKIISAPSLEDREAPPKEEEFEIIEPEIRRTVKSQIARAKRVNVQKLTYKKQKAEAVKKEKEEEEEAIEEELAEAE